MGICIVRALGLGLYVFSLVSLIIGSKNQVALSMENQTDYSGMARLGGIIFRVYVPVDA